MYTPPAFRQNDLAQLHQQISACPLATVVNQGASGLLASHLPLLLATDEGEFGTLYGHFARVNPHWRELVQGETLAIFRGPQAYISPDWYPAKAEHGKEVPTWNYIAVHARGQAELIEDREGLLQLVSRLSAEHEAGRDRDSAWFSILDREWPACQTAFQLWLASDNFETDGRQKQRLEQLRTGNERG